MDSDQNTLRDWLTNTVEVEDIDGVISRLSSLGIYRLTHLQPIGLIRANIHLFGLRLFEQLRLIRTLETQYNDRFDSAPGHGSENPQTTDTVSSSIPVCTTTRMELSQPHDSKSDDSSQFSDLQILNENERQVLTDGDYARQRNDPNVCEASNHDGSNFESIPGPRTSNPSIKVEYSGNSENKKCPFTSDSEPDDNEEMFNRHYVTSEMSTEHPSVIHQAATRGEHVYINPRTNSYSGHRNPTIIRKSSKVGDRRRDMTIKPFMQQKRNIEVGASSSPRTSSFVSPQHQHTSSIMNRNTKHLPSAESSTFCQQGRYIPIVTQSISCNMDGGRGVESCTHKTIKSKGTSIKEDGSSLPGSKEYCGQITHDDMTTFKHAMPLTSAVNQCTDSNAISPNVPFNIVSTDPTRNGEEHPMHMGLIDSYSNNDDIQLNSPKNTTRLEDSPNSEIVVISDIINKELSCTAEQFMRNKSPSSPSTKSGLSASDSLKSDISNTSVPSTSYGNMTSSLPVECHEGPSNPDCNAPILGDPTNHLSTPLDSATTHDNIGHKKDRSKHGTEISDESNLSNDFASTNVKNVDSSGRNMNSPVASSKKNMTSLSSFPEYTPEKTLITDDQRHDERIPSAPVSNIDRRTDKELTRHDACTGFVTQAATAPRKHSWKIRAQLEYRDAHKDDTDVHMQSVHGTVEDVSQNRQSGNMDSPLSRSGNSRNDEHGSSPSVPNDPSHTKETVPNFTMENAQYESNPTLDNEQNVKRHMMTNHINTPSDTEHRDKYATCSRIGDRRCISYNIKASDKRKKHGSNSDMHHSHGTTPMKSKDLRDEQIIDRTVKTHTKDTPVIMVEETPQTNILREKATPSHEYAKPMTIEMVQYDNKYKIRKRPSRITHPRQYNLRSKQRKHKVICRNELNKSDDHSYAQNTQNDANSSTQRNHQDFISTEATDQHDNTNIVCRDVHHASSSVIQNTNNVDENSAKTTKDLSSSTSIDQHEYKSNVGTNPLATDDISMTDLRITDHSQRIHDATNTHRIELTGDSSVHNKQKNRDVQVYQPAMGRGAHGNHNGTKNCGRQKPCKVARHKAKRQDEMTQTHNNGEESLPETPEERRKRKDRERHKHYYEQSRRMREHDPNFKEQQRERWKEKQRMTRQKAQSKNINVQKQNAVGQSEQEQPSINTDRSIAMPNFRIIPGIDYKMSRDSQPVMQAPRHDVFLRTGTPHDDKDVPQHISLSPHISPEIRDYFQRRTPVLSFRPGFANAGRTEEAHYISTPGPMSEGYTRMVQTPELASLIRQSMLMPGNDQNV